VERLDAPHLVLPAGGGQRVTADGEAERVHHADSIPGKCARAKLSPTRSSSSGDDAVFALDD
jgi:hypothetical protein